MSKITFPVRFALALLTAALPLGAATAETPKTFTVVVDAGHGGKDPGARGRTSNEKDINLAIALKAGKLIKEQAQNVDVLFTRTKDVYLTVAERPVFANDKHADLFISVHTNSSTNPAASGTETFTLGVAKTKDNLQVAINENSVILLEDDYKQTYQGFDPKSVDSYIMFEFMQDKHMEQSITLASAIQDGFREKCRRKDRGVQQAGFWVLKNTAMPAVLVEVGFISNPEEEIFLNSEKGQTQLAQAICNAFVAYKREYDKKNGTTVSAQQPQTAPSVAATPAGKTYRIQLMASRKLLPSTDAAFKGLKDIRHYEENNLYKYTYGDTEDYERARALEAEAKKHFKDAFIVTFVNGEKSRK